ncbi:Tubulin-specific chaperone D [Cryptosporidium felis]|nr:Tubulin-specific chaperone D [Cryptosporidium felis]
MNCEEDESKIPSYSNKIEYLHDINQLITFANTELTKYKDVEYDEYKKYSIEFNRRIDMYQEQPYVLDSYLENICSPLTNCLAEFFESISSALHESVVSLVSNEQNQKVNCNREKVSNSNSKSENTSIPKIHINQIQQMNIFRLSDCIYNLCKIRGHKVISLYFPSTVSFLEVVIDYISLENQIYSNLNFDSACVDPSFESPCEPNSVLNTLNKSLHEPQQEDWHLMYILYVWLTNLVLIPFSFETLDSKYMLEDKSLFIRILEVIIPKIVQDKYCVINETASIVFAKMACRTDFRQLWEHDGKPFKNLLIDRMQNTPNSLGILVWLKYLIKLGPVENIELFFEPIIDYLYIPNNGQLKNPHYGNCNNLDYGNTCYKSESCRLKCISRLMIRCIQSNNLLKNFLNFEEILDWVMNTLFQYNKNSHGLLRHTSSKCIAKVLYFIKNREKINSLMQEILMIKESRDHSGEKYFVPNEITPFELEGKCLTIAELLRRRISFVFEEFLNVILIFLEHCLNYEYWIGSRNFGIQIRDSACYIIWSLARGVPPEVLRPHSNKIISSIIPLTVFDPNINGRRSSCAALQELIGRQGGENVPFGISIITIADFFSISSLKTSFLEVSIRIGALDTTNTEDLGQLTSQLSSNQKYTEQSERDLRYPFAVILSDYLIKNIFIHPNIKFRLLAACALSKLVPYCHNFCYFGILALVSKTKIMEYSLRAIKWDNDLNVFSSNYIYRHSSLLIISVFISKASRSKNEKTFWSSKVETNDLNNEKESIKRVFGPREQNLNSHMREFTWSDYLRNIPILIEKNRLYRGRGGDLTRKGVLHLIVSLSKSTEIIPYKKATFLRYLQTICESIKHLSFSIQISGCSAMDALNRWRMPKSKDSPEFVEIQNVLNEFLNSLNSEVSNIHIMALRGIILAIGVIFPHIVELLQENQITEIVHSLVKIFNKDTSIISREDHPKSLNNPSNDYFVLISKFDVECRRNSIWSLGMVCHSIKDIEFQRRNQILELSQKAFIMGCFDYSTDKRGDVGSWIRELSMETIASLQTNKIYSGESVVDKILPAFLFNIFNYSDKLRIKAILLLWKILFVNFNDSYPLDFVPKINMYWIYYRIFYGIPFELFEISQIQALSEPSIIKPTEKHSLKFRLFQSCNKMLEDILREYTLIHNKDYIFQLKTFFSSEENLFNSSCCFFDLLESIEQVPHSLLPYLDFENQFLFCLSNRNFQIISNSAFNVFNKCFFPFILEENLQKAILLGLVNWTSHSSGIISSTPVNPFQTINYELNIFLKSTENFPLSISSIFSRVGELLKLTSTCKKEPANFISACITVHTLQFLLVLLTWGVYPNEKMVLSGIFDSISLILKTSNDFKLIKISSALLVYFSFNIEIFKYEGLNQEAMEMLSTLISHQYPNIRSYTTECIYNNICHIQHSRRIEAILQFIRETDWARECTTEELNRLKSEFVRIFGTYE